MRFIFVLINVVFFMQAADIQQLQLTHAALQECRMHNFILYQRLYPLVTKKMEQICQNAHLEIPLKTTQEDEATDSPKGSGSSIVTPGGPQEAQDFIQVQRDHLEFCLNLMDAWAKYKATEYKTSENLNRFYVDSKKFFEEIKIPGILQPVISHEILKQNKKAVVYRKALAELSKEKIELKQAGELLDGLIIEQALFIFCALRDFHYTLYIAPEEIKVFDAYEEEYKQDANYKKGWKSERDKEFARIRKSLPEPLKKLFKKKIGFNGYGMNHI